MLIVKAGSRQAGFSLTELMIGILVISLLMGLAAPSFRIWLQNSQIRSAAESIQSGLQRARTEAVTRNVNIEFELGADSSWVVRIVGGANLDSRSSNEGSVNVTRTITPVGATKITFNSFGGVATNADGSAALTQIELDSSKLSAAESHELRVTIGLGGSSRMCDPSVPASNPRGC